ncbi:hypothetical protein PANA5342_3028 [Pantoea ananatis LMG 5342]|nr:hypothetical protein PANA5342_3028 [Pantoea ananatis LMG 5342]
MTRQHEQAFSEASTKKQTRKLTSLRYCVKIQAIE